MFYPPKGLCEAEPNGVHLILFILIVVREGYLTLSKSLLSGGLFKILKMFYPQKGLCEAEPNGVHFDSFHFIVFEKGCLDLYFQRR